MIITIAAIAGKNVQPSLRSCGNHFLAIVAITAIIWNQPIWKLLSDQLFGSDQMEINLKFQSFALFITLGKETKPTEKKTFKFL